MHDKGLSPVETPDEYEAAWDARLRVGQGDTSQQEADEGHRRRRPLRARHRAPRVAPHRQPAARSFRPSGRPGREPLLPVAAGRPHAPVQQPAPPRRSWAARNVPDDIAIESKVVSPRDPQRAVAGRGAQRRDPQERAQVRRRAQPPARGDLRRPPPHPRGRRPARPRAEVPRGRDRRGHRRAHRRGPRATTGTSRRSGPS